MSFRRILITVAGAALDWWFRVRERTHQTSHESIRYTEADGNLINATGF